METTPSGPTPSHTDAALIRVGGRRGWVAGVVGSVLCGLGQLYAGRWRRALAFFLADALVFVVCLVAFLHIGTEPVNVWLPVAVYLGYRSWTLVDGVRLARNAAEPLRRRWFPRWTLYVALVVAYYLPGRHLFAMVIRDHVAEVFFVPTGAMSDTIVPGDRIMVDKLLYGEPSRHEVVVYRHTGKNGTVFNYVSRIVGLPGETIEIRDGDLTVDGRVLDEPYVRLDGPVDAYGAVVVPAGSYFVLGDRRNRSVDSRNSKIGFIPRARVIGRARAILASADLRTNEVTWERAGRVIR